MNDNTCTLSRTTIRRLAKDIRDIHKHPLTEHGIHYIHDNDDILQGSALIIGPKNSIYEGGYYIFSFKFPVNYPHSPPVVIFNTTNGHTRFHPNLYKSGKVCLSLLNTWEGDQWSGCQSITSILLSICSILTNDSLLHEPGITKKHIDYKNYHEIIRYENINFAICNFISNMHVKTIFTELFEIIKLDLIDTYQDKIKLIDRAYIQYKKSKCDTNIKTGIYMLKSKIDYDSLKGNLAKTFNKLKLN
jgi:ubiquitin-conjugating enzyme E2 Z